MADKLTDPSKPAHEIIEVLEDGDANSGLRPANKNPWYVLATIYGEQEEGEIDPELAAKNRRAWNGWFCGELSDEDRAGRAEKLDLDVAELMPLTHDERAEIVKRFVQRVRAAGATDAQPPDPDQTIDFSEVVITRPLCFRKFVFVQDVTFDTTRFESIVDLDASVFLSKMDFCNATLLGRGNFSSCIFCGEVNFMSAMFCEAAFFAGVEVKRGVDFSSAQFMHGTSFLGAIIRGVRFNSAIFCGQAEFRNVVFSHHVSFRNVTFGGETLFHSAKFSGIYYHQVLASPFLDFSFSTFKSITLFNDVKFHNIVPDFHGAKLYDNTVFPTPDKYTENWPPLNGTVKVEGEDEPVAVMPAEDQKRAYNRLRLFMNRSLQIDEEQFFHRQEMRCKREIEENKGMRCLYDLFEGISGYGNSVLRPAGWLFVVWVSGALAKLDAVQGGWWPDYHSILPAMGWSFANLFSFFGFQRRYFGVGELSTVLQVFGGVQTVFGFILLFFLGLGLRNRFRLR